MMGRRRFEYVAFWDSCAWVACTIGPYIVSQGRTLAEAIRSLRSSLSLTAKYCAQRGLDPWGFLHHDGLRSPPEFAARLPGALSAVMGHDGDRSKNYRGAMWVDGPSEGGHTPRGD